MTTDAVLKLLVRLERRLATIEDQARETCAQAEHTLTRLGRLRLEIERIHREVIASVGTSDDLPIFEDKPPDEKRGE